MTKTELIARVNHEFPRYWERLLAESPAVAWPKTVTFPSLHSVSADVVGGRFGDSGLLSAVFTEASGAQYKIIASYTVYTQNGSYVAADRVGGGESMVEREMLRFLLADILGAMMSDSAGVAKIWLSLPD